MQHEEKQLAARPRKWLFVYKKRKGMRRITMGIHICEV
jgi:hypothetical protein